MTQCTVTIEPQGITRTCNFGTTILDLLVDEGLQVKTPCGGRGTCGKCLVEAGGSLSEPDEDEEQFIRDNPRMRLACRACITGDAVITMPRIGKAAEGPSYPVDTSSLFGIAVDLGTTTIQVSFVDLGSGAVFPAASFLNPQRRYGHDVIARIAAAHDPAARRELVRLVRTSLAHAILDRAAEAGIAVPSLKKIVISGNTTMTYLLLDLDTSPLGSYPYVTAVKDFTRITALDLFPGTGLDAQVSCLPSASAYLGGDLLGGMTLLDLQGPVRNTFFFDIGTNGEMFLRTGDDAVFATSCAMGPALEGMNISSGMTAEEGGINHVRLREGVVEYDVIGRGEPVGITGTGVIDLIAVLLRSRMLADTGAFDRAALVSPPVKNITVVPDGSAVMLHRRAALNRKDIRAVQLAKSASLAAARLLLREARCDAGLVSDVVIAGSFGENLDLESFRRLAFLPEFPHARYHFAGNTSLQAAEYACRDRDFIARAAFLRDRTQVIELSDHPLFNETFMSSLDFTPAP